MEDILDFVDEETREIIDPSNLIISNEIFHEITRQILSMNANRNSNPTKKVLCKFFVMGSCSRGDYCKFSHQLPESTACMYFAS